MFQLHINTKVGNNNYCFTLAINTFFHTFCSNQYVKILGCKMLIIIYVAIYVVASFELAHSLYVSIDKLNVNI